MRRFHRFLTVCLLVLALPMQGYAAQTMKLCGMGQLPPQVASQEHSAAQDPVNAERAAHTAHADHHQEAEASTAHQHEGKCSVCATCCNAAMVGSTWPAPLAALPPVHLVPTIAQAHSRLPEGGLDRPPRSALG